MVGINDLIFKIIVHNILNTRKPILIIIIGNKAATGNKYPRSLAKIDRPLKTPKGIVKVKLSSVSTNNKRGRENAFKIKSVIISATPFNNSWCKFKEP